MALVLNGSGTIQSDDITLSGNANVTGTLTSTGELTGTLTGNADSATKLSTATGSAPSYSARAWINMDGTGTISIRDSGNVSSITDNGTGDYTVNFSTNMSGTNYNVVGSSNHNTTYANSRMFFQSISTLRLTSSVRVRALGDGGSALDVDTVDFCIFE